tara:strand:- start:1411 stop:1710 length:300 start_codon:yes stop_codon:yes gene_type:complete
MATKTWKLGEVCRGGIITVETKKNKVTIIGKEWDYNMGSRRGSNQSNAKEFTRTEVDFDNDSSAREASDFLHDLTTSYHVDQIMKWVGSKVKVNRGLHW